MIRSLCQRLNQGIEVRQTLSALRKEIKEGNNKILLLSWINDENLDLIPFLSNEDPKTRKNTALLMGDLALPMYKDSLIKAYEKEETLFIRSSYIKAFASYDMRDALPLLKNRLEVLTKTKPEDSDKKHMEEESRGLRELILLMEGPAKHDFHPNGQTFSCILRTNELHPNVTREQIADDTEATKQGVRVTTNHLEKILPVRTYGEILFLIPGMTQCPMDIQEAAKTIASSEILDLLKDTHDGDFPFYFRLGIKSKMTLLERSKFTKELGAAIEKETDGKLVNSPSHYEIEFRLIETSKKVFAVVAKFYTIKDSRFAYRMEHIPTSIKPVNAALLVELAKDYMIPDAQVLDPFCGVGTMLIERQLVMKANTSYGIDIYGEAIDKAKVNTDAAGQIIHYINKDCFDFTHDYSFDEIFTELPFAQGSVSKDDVENIYKEFFHMARRVMTPEGTIIMYTRDLDLVRKYCIESHFTILKYELISEKENSHLVILR